jgi:hypothetical protein
MGLAKEQQSFSPDHSNAGCSCWQSVPVAAGGTSAHVLLLLLLANNTHCQCSCATLTSKRLRSSGCSGRDLDVNRTPRFTAGSKQTGSAQQVGACQTAWQHQYAQAVSMTAWSGCAGATCNEQESGQVASGMGRGCIRLLYSTQVPGPPPMRTCCCHACVCIITLMVAEATWLVPVGRTATCTYTHTHTTLLYTLLL